MTPFKRQYGEYLGIFEDALNAYCAQMNFKPDLLAEGMRYSLLSGGKRMRPVLFFGTLDLFGGDCRTETGLALALECIHTYSLIHDDLPAMDNDDFRRGNPSNHKVFGEANAILAGDALLSEALELLLKEGARGERHLRAARYLAHAAGASGMVAGQSADLLYAGKEGDLETLDFIYRHKTGMLLSAPVVMAAILTGADERAAEAFGLELGKLFQITDDLLDDSPGKESTDDKLTCVKVLGRSASRLLADQTAASCRALLKALKESAFLDELITFVRSRDN